MLLHSDQSVQYTCEVFQRSLKEHGLVSSMSRAGNCLDNAVIERLFRSLKLERINDHRYQTRRDEIKLKCLKKSPSLFDRYKSE